MRVLFHQITSFKEKIAITKGPAVMCRYAGQEYTAIYSQDKVTIILHTTINWGNTISLDTAVTIDIIPSIPSNNCHRTTCSMRTMQSSSRRQQGGQGGS